MIELRRCKRPSDWWNICSILLNIPEMLLTLKDIWTMFGGRLFLAISYEGGARKLKLKGLKRGGKSMFTAGIWGCGGAWFCCCGFCIW
jgi:hypothetical protein